AGAGEPGDGRARLRAPPPPGGDAGGARRRTGGRRIPVLLRELRPRPPLRGRAAGGDPRGRRARRGDDVGCPRGGRPRARPHPDVGDHALRRPPHPAARRVLRRARRRGPALPLPRPRRRDLEGQLPHGRRAHPRGRRPARRGGVRLVHEPAHLRHHRPARAAARQAGPHRQPAHRLGLPRADGASDGRAGPVAARRLRRGQRDPGTTDAHRAGGGGMTTVGIIYPDHAAEDEYAVAAELLGVRLPVVHVYGTDLHAVPELRDLGSPERLAGGAAALAAHRPDSVMWACTSGSFVYGYDGAQEQVDELARVTGVPTSSTSIAFVAALTALGLSRVAVAAAGIGVVAMGSAGILPAAQVGLLGPAEVGALATARDHPDAEALLVPDTAMRTLPVVPELEARVGKPVLTANQVTIWQGLRLAGATPSSPSLGTLFTRRQDHAPE